MKKPITLLLAILFIPAAAFAAEPDGWNPWLYIGEAAAGFALGLVRFTAYSGLRRTK